MHLKLASYFGAIVVSFILFGCQSPASPGAGTDLSVADTGAEATLAPFVGTWTQTEVAGTLSTEETLTVTSSGLSLSMVQTDTQNTNDYTLDFSGDVVETISSGSSKAEFVVQFTASNATGINSGVELTVGQFAYVLLSLNGDSLAVSWSNPSSATQLDAKSPESLVDLSGLKKP